MKAFALFVSRDALNIEGLSEATLEKFISRGYIHTFADIFHLDHYKDEIQGMEGFGEKSYRKLIESVEKQEQPRCQELSIHWESQGSDLPMQRLSAES